MTKLEFNVTHEQIQYIAKNMRAMDRLECKLSSGLDPYGALAQSVDSSEEYSENASPVDASPVDASAVDASPVDAA